MKEFLELFYKIILRLFLYMFISKIIDRSFPILDKKKKKYIILVEIIIQILMTTLLIYVFNGIKENSMVNDIISYGLFGSMSNLFSKIHYILDI
jgi:hypothetical protein